MEKLDIFVIVYLDDILIYTDDNRDGYVAAVRWVLEQLRKFSLFANLKKCQFYQEKVWFFGYVVFSKNICIEDKKIKAVKQWPEPQLVQDIQVFFGFANFYHQFIQGFSRIAALCISMLKTSGSTESLTQLGEGLVRVEDDSKAGYDGSKLNKSEIDDGEVGGGEVDDEVEKKGQKTFKSKKLFKSKKTVESSNFFTPGARLAFTKLR